MRRRLKRSTQKYIAASVTGILAIAAVLTILFLAILHNLHSDYETEVNKINQQFESRKITVYEAKTDITAGSLISRKNLKQVSTYSWQPKNYYMTEEELGNTAVIDIKAGTFVLKEMLTQDKIEDNVREAEFNSILLNSNIHENNFVDIRLMLPNGENYIVLSKKKIVKLSENTGSIFLWLDAEEIIRVSGAIVDCFLNNGSKLYTVKYVEPTIQEASKITYVPSEEIIKLIKEDPNIVDIAESNLSANIRAQLESRLEQFNSKYGDAISLNQYNNPATVSNVEDLKENDNNGEEASGVGIAEDGNHTENKEEEEEIYYVD